MDQLSDYIQHFIGQQRCHRHTKEKAKMIKLKTNFKESFICVQCIETDTECEMMSIKRALDIINNFIMFDQSKTPSRTADIKLKLASFIDQFNNALQSVEMLLAERDQQLEAFSKTHYQKVNELERIQKYLTNLVQSRCSEPAQQIQLNDNLKSSVLLLIQNEQLLNICNKKSQDAFDQLIQDKFRQLEQVLNDQTLVLQGMATQVGNPMSSSNCQSRVISRNHSMGNLSNSPRQMFYSTFTSQLSKSMLHPFQFKLIHPTLKAITPTKLSIPINNNGHKTNEIRLALIAPRLQEGPLKPSKSITFHIEQQIMSNIQVGVCEVGQQVLDVTKPHKLFSAAKYPYFNRGDQITLTVNPATGFIQLVKNKLFNQPIQAELPLDCWTNMMFVVASQDNGGGGEVHIIYDDSNIQL